MKSSGITFIVTLLVSVAATAGFFLAKPDPLAATVKKLEAEVLKARDEAGKLKIERDQLMAEVKKAAAKPPKVASLASNDPAAISLSAEAKPGSDAAKADDSSPGDALRKMMSNPGMRDMMRKQQEVQIDMTYGKLFQKLSLNGEELDNFKRLLGDRLGSQTDASMKLMDPKITAVERKAVMDQISAGKKQSDEDIRKFLNNEDDYKTYQHWEDTQPERMTLQLGGSAFDLAGAPLSDEQREQLVGTMADIRKSPSPLPDLNDPRNISPESLTSDGIAKQLERHKADDTRVRDEAAKFLSPQQVEALKKMQDQMLVMMEAGMKMSGQMFGSGKK